jgi:hypothetical protein
MKRKLARQIKRNADQVMPQPVLVVPKEPEPLVAERTEKAPEVKELDVAMQDLNSLNLN